MIKLSLAFGTTRRDLGRGVVVEVRRLTHQQWEAARDRAADAVARFREGAAALEPYGLHTPDQAGSGFDPSDPGLAYELAVLVGAVETALAAVVSWEGLALEDGSSAPVTRETLAVFLQDHLFARGLLEACAESLVLLRAEGNGLGPSPAGSSEPTGALPTAAAVPPTTSPALGEDQA